MGLIGIRREGKGVGGYYQRPAWPVEISKVPHRGKRDFVSSMNCGALRLVP
jgi:hypothetical protein